MVPHNGEKCSSFEAELLLVSQKTDNPEVFSGKLARAWDGVASCDFCHIA